MPICGCQGLVEELEERRAVAVARVHSAAAELASSVDHVAIKKTLKQLGGLAGQRDVLDAKEGVSFYA
eukprot:SAG31_NODE_10637_length_1114_cov_1.878818_2_plen_68_part_00